MSPIPSPADVAETTLRMLLPADETLTDFTPWIAENLGILQGFGRWLEVGQPDRSTSLSVRWAYWRGRRLASTRLPERAPPT